MFFNGNIFVLSLLDVCCSIRFLGVFYEIIIFIYSFYNDLF